MGGWTERWEVKFGQILEQARALSELQKEERGKEGIHRKKTSPEPWLKRSAALSPRCKEAAREMGPHHTPSTDLTGPGAGGRESLLADAETMPGTWSPRGPVNTFRSIMPFQTQHVTFHIIHIKPFM